MKSADYWKKRFEQLENRQYNKSVEYYNRVSTDFDKASVVIQGKINAWYKRLADNNNISYAEAIQLLKKNELKEFQWTLEDYIKFGKENALNQQWMKELENASAKAHITRLESIKFQIQNEIETLYSGYEDSIQSFMTNSYTECYYRSAYEIQKGTGIGSNLSKLDERKIQKAVSEPWAADGKNFSERIWGDKQKLMNNLNQNLTQSIIRGDDPQKAINTIAKSMNTSKRNAGRLVMTESSFVYSAAQKDCFNELDIEKYEIVATLDIHTSEICRGLDGKVFIIKDYQVGVTAPPFHCYCRSVTVPYFSDEFTKGEKRVYRGEDGKTQLTDGDITYEEWKKEYVRETQSKIVEQSVSKSKKTGITDTAISKVKRIQLDGYTDNELDILQEMHKELLRDAMVNNQSNEVVNMFSTVFDKKVGVYGDETSVRVSESADARAFMMGANDRSVLWMHNHPKGSSFSYEDIGSFLDSKIKTMTVVTNKGKVFALNKTNSFDIKGLYDKIKEIRNSYVSTSQYQDDIARDILKIITKYGVQYVK